MGRTGAEQAARRAPGRLFIAGEWQDAAGGALRTSRNPATGAAIIEVADAGAADVQHAVDGAHAALSPSGRWRRMDAADRGALLWRIADAIETDAARLAALETTDTGKPLRESKIDIRMTVDVFRYYAGWTTKLAGETLPVRGAALNYTLREPVGVVGAIVPWNFPLLMAAYKLAPALACGNAVLLKPSEETPLTALEFAAIAEAAGLPEGVLSVLPGAGVTAGAALVAHAGIDRIAFTGSTAVGRQILRESAATLKRVSLELGGKSPNVVLGDADLDAAARGACNAVFYNAGQCCTAGARLLVHRSIHDALIERIVARARRLAPGDPFDPQTRMGPLVSETQLARVLGYVARGRAEGATLATGGNRADYLGEPRGFWMQPTVFTGVAADATIAREEIFGPVLAALAFDDDEEAIALANATEYGLAAGVWTRDVKKAHRFARALQAGTVWINTYHPLDAASPFGGYKQSGYGRDLGREALDFHTQTKSVWVDLG